MKYSKRSTAHLEAQFVSDFKVRKEENFAKFVQNIRIWASGIRTYFFEIIKLVLALKFDLISPAPHFRASEGPLMELEAQSWGHSG